MKTQLLAAVIASTIVISSASSQASNLSFAFRTLQSSQRTPARPQTLQPVMNTPGPQTLELALPQLLLGAYLEDVSGGLRVAGTVPGSTAEQVLQAGDMIRRVSALGYDSRTVDTRIQFEHAKREIGANRQVVLEIFRPGAGVANVWVTFRPTGELATFDADVVQFKARSMFDTPMDTQVSN